MRRIEIFNVICFLLFLFWFFLRRKRGEGDGKEQQVPEYSVKHKDHSVILRNYVLNFHEQNEVHARQ